MDQLKEKIFTILPALPYEDEHTNNDKTASELKILFEDFSKQFAIFLWEYRNNVDKWEWKKVEELLQEFEKHYNKS